MLQFINRPKNSDFMTCSTKQNCFFLVFANRAGSVLLISQAVKRMTEDDQICDYLNITVALKNDTNNLTGKFVVLDSSKNLSMFEWLFSSMIHQLIVAKCAFQFNVARIGSDSYRDNELIHFNGMGYISPVVTWILLPNVFTPISIVLNISLIWVTITKIEGHKVCNWLLAYESLCQLFVVVPFGTNLLGVLLRYSPIDYRICLATLMASTVASYASTLAIYLISIERLLIIMFPLRMYWNQKSIVRRWSIIAVILCTIYGLIMNFNVFKVWTIINLPYDRWLYCNSGLYSDVMNTIPSYVILLLCAVNYAVIFGLILWRHFLKIKGKVQIESISNAADQSMRKMLRSVFLLLLVVLLGWLITSAARNLITDFIRNKVPLIVNCFVSDRGAQQRIAYNISSVLIGIITCVPIWASASGAPILLLSSNDYRKAYKKTLQRRSNNISAAGPMLFTKQIMINTSGRR